VCLSQCRLCKIEKEQQGEDLADLQYSRRHRSASTIKRRVRYYTDNMMEQAGAYWSLDTS
jgi:hypothetical protein